MNSLSTGQSLWRPVPPLLRVLQLGSWAFALLALCFFVPEAGFKSRGGFSVLAVVWPASLLTVFIAAEAWSAHRAAQLSRGGLAGLVLLTAFAAVLLGWGIPAAYYAYILPTANTVQLPYVMVGAGSAVWVFLFGASRLVWRARA